MIMSEKIIRDSSGNVMYKLQENKLYNTTTVRDNHGNKIATYSNKEPNLKTTTEKLRNR